MLMKKEESGNSKNALRGAQSKNKFQSDNSRKTAYLLFCIPIIVCFHCVALRANIKATFITKAIHKSFKEAINI